MDVIWKPIEATHGVYEVSNTGEVRRINPDGSPSKPLKGHITGGYKQVMLYDHCKYKHAFVHRLVASAFIPNDKNKRTVNHKDGNKLNNNVDNLEWMTHSENHKHAYRTGIRQFTEKQRNACRETGKRTCETNRGYKPVIMTDSTGNEMRFNSIHDGARYVNGAASAIVRCCKGKQKTHKGYGWRYDD